MLNTLANHGHLPRDGKDISREVTIDALSSVLNWDIKIGSHLFDMARSTNPEPNATSFDLSHLTTHNILEHDASLSRQDAYFGPADVFNQAIWNETLQYFTGPIIDLAMASRARTARVVTSAANNPQFTLRQVGLHFTYGESAAYQFVLGEWVLHAEDPKKRLLTPKDLVQYFFVNERLPYELGWTTPENRLDVETLHDMVCTIQDITGGQMNGTIP
jgi:hypothetical protein